MLVCENITVSYDSKIVLKDVSFEINDGEYIAVVGDNGSGKTTLFKAILGEVALDSGKIKLTEFDKIGYLPQNISLEQAFSAQVFEVVMSGFVGKMGARPFYRSNERELALENMRKIGIVELKKDFFCELSGGQKQRVLLARALCASDKFLMLDEPVASLDATSTKEFYDLIRQLHAEGMTIFMISHDNAVIADSDKVLVMSGHSAALMSRAEYISRVN